MATIFYEKDGDVEIVKSMNVTILGYGSQGHAQALNLRDSGVNVKVFVRKDGKGYELAKKHGWIEGKNLFTNIIEAIKDADWIQFLLPDETQKSIYENFVQPNMKKNVTLGFSHGFNIRYSQIVAPSSCDVVLIAPKGPGHLVRRAYTEGIGVPALVAVENDASKMALNKALSYAKAIGALRAGAILTTFAEETETDNFGEQVILCGGVVELIKKAFETLVESGYQPEVAYFECLHELKLITDMIHEGGISWMNYSVSDTAEYGEYTRGPRIITEQTKNEMKKILEEIRSGEFAREYLLENMTGRIKFNSYRKAMQEHLIEKVGQEIRKMMPWLKKKE
ncbi:MAG: ketol-acid reductoisomerase [bacterium]|nr:ketol-acid reductoisomerase [bacterium]